MNMDIVIIDDDAVILFLHKILIQKSPLPSNVTEFKNASEGLEFLSSRSSETPLLVFLDINMPEINGFEFLDVVQEQMKKDCWPALVILTSSINRRDLDRVASYPCVRELLVKPLTLDILQKKIEEHCPKDAS